jgi:hypothetical protein
MNMDFKSLINKLDSMDAPIRTPAAPELPKAVQLNEDAELRVLAGTSSYIAEAKKKAEEKKDEKVDEVFDADAKVGDKKKTSKGVATKTATGLKHEKTYAGDDTSDADDDSAAKKKKAKKESIDPEQFKAKFSKMVEAAKPDFLDIDGDGDKKEPMKKAAAEKGGDKKDGKKGMSDKQAKYFGKKESVKEESDMKVGDKKKSSTGGTIEKTKTGVKHTAGKNYGGKAAEDEAKKSKKDESVTRSKKVVAESVEQSLSFREMMKLVVESGGQQQIDPVDAALFSWAKRVASQKLGEGMKAEVYAGMVYERMGGRFEMYDVLSEDQN